MNGREMIGASIVERAARGSGVRGLHLLGRKLCALTVPSAIAEIGEIVQDEIIDRDRSVWPAGE